MYRIQWLSDYTVWHTSHATNSEQGAMQAALRLANSARHRAVRVITRDGAVIYLASG